MELVPLKFIDQFLPTLNALKKKHFEITGRYPNAIFWSESLRKKVTAIGGPLEALAAYSATGDKSKGKKDIKLIAGLAVYEIPNGQNGDLLFVTIVDFANMLGVDVNLPEDK